MASITTRAGKGTPLTNAEVDANFTNLNADIATRLLVSNNLSDLANAATARTNLGVAIGTNVQAWDGDLDAIAALVGTSGFLKKTAANTWALDTSTYLTGNQTITVSGDASGSGTTAITLTLATVPVSKGGTGATTLTGLLKGNGTSAFTAAVAGTDYVVPSALNSYLALTGGTLTSTNSTGTLVISDSGTSGANIKLTGNGATTPSKTIRSFSGNFSIINNAYSAEIFTLSDAGVITNSTWNGATVGVAYGGTGATTLTGIIKGNGTSAFTAAVAGTDYVVPSALTSYAPLASPTFTGTPAAPTQASSVSSTALATTAYVKSLFGAASTAGTLDWNDVTNTRPGAGPTLLLGTATNGMGGSNYYHPFNIEYNSKDGTGNVTQMAVAYGNVGNELYMRGRYLGTWTGWARFLNDSNYSSYALPLAGGTLTGNLTLGGTRLLADFTSAATTRVVVQTSTTNGNTFFTVVPNGTSTNSQLQVFGSSDLANAPFGTMTINATALQIQSSALGTGTTLPLRFMIGATETARFSTGANFLIGGTTDDGVNKLQVTGSATFSSTVTASGFTGNASSASKWATARTESLTGDVTGSASVDGSANWSIATTLAASGVTAGTYTNATVTVDAKGRVTSASSGAGGVTTGKSIAMAIVFGG